MPDEPDKYEKFKIREYPCWTLYLHSNQYYIGRCYAWLKREGEMQRFSSITSEELFELHDSVMPGYEAAVNRLWKPGFINNAWLCNEFHTHGGHGHMHLIPRYKHPVRFFKHEFRDNQWGHNYAPYPKLKLPKKMLLRIRDALRNEIR